MGKGIKTAHPLALVRNGFRGYERAFVVSLILGSVAGALGGIGIGTLVPLFSFFVEGSAAPANKLAEFIYGAFAFINVTPQPFYLIGLILALLIAKAGIVFWTSRYSEKIAASYEERTRRDIFQGLMHARWDFLLKQKTGYVERVIMDDAANAGQILSYSTLAILPVTSLLMYLAVAFTLSPAVTLMTLIPAGLLFLGTRGIFGKMRTITEDVIATEKEVNQHVGEHLSGVKTVKSLSAEEGAIEKAFREFKRISILRVRIVFYKLLAGSFFEPASFILIGLIFFSSYHLPGFDLASFAVTMYLIQKIFGYVQAFQANLQTVFKSLPSLESVLSYREMLHTSAEDNKGTGPFRLSKALTLTDIDFGYVGHGPLLKKVSFSAEKGRITAIIGPSGSGKTTIVDLLLRLFTPLSGTITVDDIDIRDITLASWRKGVGYVSQDVFLLNDSIENNIRFYDETVDAEAVREAARLANIHETIAALPEGYETVVGERGVKLSGGQRQRIALARVLARKPQLLILDEATSALDTESERAIQETLRAIRGSVTIIMIAHRLSTIKDADVVIAVNKGRVVETGTPEELMQNEKSYFRKMAFLAADEKSYTNESA